MLEKLGMYWKDIPKKQPLFLHVLAVIAGAGKDQNIQCSLIILIFICLCFIHFLFAWERRNSNLDIIWKLFFASKNYQVVLRVGEARKKSKTFIQFCL